MGRKRLIVGQSEWTIENNIAEKVAEEVEVAMTKGIVAKFDLLDAADRVVTVYLNGSAAQSVVVDMDLGPRPTEIPG